MSPKSYHEPFLRNSCAFGDNQTRLREQHCASTFLAPARHFGPGGPCWAAQCSEAEEFDRFNQSSFDKPRSSSSYYYTVLDSGCNDASSTYGSSTPSQSPGMAARFVA